MAILQELNMDKVLLTQNKLSLHLVLVRITIQSSWSDLLSILQFNILCFSEEYISSLLPFLPFFMHQIPDTDTQHSLLHTGTHVCLCERTEILSHKP